MTKTKDQNSARKISLLAQACLRTKTKPISVARSKGVFARWTLAAGQWSCLGLPGVGRAPTVGVKTGLEGVLVWIVRD